MLMNSPPQIIIAQLNAKHLKKTSQNSSYYLLQITFHQNLTRLYSQLTESKTSSLKTSQPLYLFSEKNKWGSKLKVNYTYLFHYQKRNNYLHLTDWKILGDYQTIKRAWRLLLIKEEEEKNK